MFYEGLGLLLRRGAEVLERTPPQADDERSQRQLRMLTSLVRRSGVVLPMMFGAVEDELRVLERTRADLDRDLIRLGRRSPCGAAPVPADGDDPLARLRRLRAQIDDGVVELHRCDADDPEVAAARRSLRRGLREAAEIEGKLVDAMLAA